MSRPLRKAQGMTQVQVAKVMGVTQRRISQIGRGGVCLAHRRCRRPSCMPSGAS
ncbi:helix-turn-helix transcriptional regulator [Streptomyces sp. M10(2022)]